MYDLHFISYAESSDIIVFVDLYKNNLQDL